MFNGKSSNFMLFFYTMGYDGFVMYLNSTYRNIKFLPRYFISAGIKIICLLTSQDHKIFFKVFRQTDGDIMQN